MKYWIEVSLRVTFDTEEAIANFLFEIGAIGCFNEHDILRAYFQESDWSDQKKVQFERYLLQLAELQFPVQPDRFRLQKIENQDWNKQWKQSIKPIEISDKIIVKPNWINIEKSPSKLVIEIEPQMAFGTGVHATTQLMLKLLVKYIGSPTRILDMGTGTGILAIAAARLCSARVLAFDNDLIATATAKQNCINNQVSNRIDLFCGTIDGIKDIVFDLILANINRSIIIESLSKIFRCLNESGLAIFSGILIDEEKQLIQAIKNFDWKIIEIAHQREWSGFVVSY